MRIQELSAVFDDRYGRPYEAYARAPGRVNLIGEHIDYEGYSVLPMALQQECAVLLARGGEDIQLVTPDGSRHPNLTYAVDIHQDVRGLPQTWGKYFMAAWKGIMEELAADTLPGGPGGLKVLVGGTIPEGAGLSSSSALVVASVLGLVHLYSIRASRVQLAEVAARRLPCWLRRAVPCAWISTLCGASLCPSHLGQPLWLPIP